MSEDENYDAKKKVDININLKGQQQGKEKVPTVSDAESLAKQLTSLGFPTEPAKDTSEYKQQKQKLQEFLAEEIGRERSERSRREGLQKAHKTVYPTSSGASGARLSGEQATGEEFSGVTDLKRMEFDSYEDMITTLKELSSQGDKEASRYLQKLYKKAVKEQGRKHMQAEYHGKITDLLTHHYDAESEDEAKERIEKKKSKWKEEED